VTIEGPADWGFDEFSVTADDLGSFTVEYLKEKVEGTFTVTATDGTTRATTTFTDSVTSVTITSPTEGSPVTVTSLPATITVLFNYVTSSTGTTIAVADVLGTSASASKGITPGTGSDSINVTIPAGTANGSHNVKVTVTNTTGTGANSKNDNQQGAVIVNVPTPSDTTKPVVTVSFPTPLSGWFTTSPVVGSVEANDTTTGGSNIVSITCEGATLGVITGLNSPVAKAPLTVSGDGLYIVDCNATDSAGNTGTGTAVFGIDMTKPTISASATNADGTAYTAGTWTNQTVTVHFTCNDSGSGVVACPEDQVYASETADTVASGTCTDVAGNISDAATFGPIKIDKTKPNPPTANVSPAPNLAGWNNSTPVTVTFTGNGDVGTVQSGVAGCTSPATLTDETLGTPVSGTCTDVAGNISAPTTVTVKIDKTPPNPPTANVSPTPNLAGWNNSTPVTVTFTGNGDVGTVQSGVTGCTSPATLTDETLGTPVSGTCTDVAGNISAPTTVTVKIDKTPPVVTITLPAPITVLLNQAGINAIAIWSATDILSGVAEPTTGTITQSLETGTVGTRTVDFTAPSGTAMDNAGNQSVAVTETYTYYIHYAFGGISPPVNADGSSIFKFGSTIPVKFQLTDAAGNFVTNAVAKLYLIKINNGVSGTDIEAASTSAATTGNLFRYNLTDNQYIFNLATKPLSIGTWQIKIELDDGTSKYVNISLRK